MTAQVTTTRRWAMTTLQAELGGSAAEVSVEWSEREMEVAGRRRVPGAMGVGLAGRAWAGVRRGGGSARGGAQSRLEVNRRVVQIGAASRSSGACIAWGTSCLFAKLRTIELLRLAARAQSVPHRRGNARQNGLIKVATGGEPIVRTHLALFRCDQSRWTGSTSTAALIFPTKHKRSR
jgi:hypothetical protein